MPLINHPNELKGTWLLNNIKIKMRECQERFPNNKILIFTYVGPGCLIDEDPVDFLTEFRKSKTRKKQQVIRKTKKTKLIKKGPFTSSEMDEVADLTSSYIKDNQTKQKKRIKVNDELLSAKIRQDKFIIHVKNTYDVLDEVSVDETDMCADVQLVERIPKINDIQFKLYNNSTEVLNKSVEFNLSYDTKEKEVKMDTTPYHLICLERMSCDIENELKSLSQKYIIAADEIKKEYEKYVNINDDQCEVFKTERDMIKRISVMLEELKESIERKRKMTLPIIDHINKEIEIPSQATEKIVFREHPDTNELYSDQSTDYGSDLDEDFIP